MRKRKQKNKKNKKKEQEEQPALENEEEREEEKKEAKVAITLKGTKQDPVTVSPSTLASYLHPEERTEETAVEYEDREASLENEREERWGNEEDETKDAALYLTNFMNKTEESYTRLKMCIAQKDETLDGIAERYDITPTDIALANGLHTNATIAKGQVLYIPVKS